jgi:pimeloyl-ACP methyl ester carboxylesterase/predicted Ser/Thr protein kinase
VAPDGVRIGYATSGAGPALVKTANWLTHLEYDWESPVWRHVHRELSRDHLLLRYDDRGNGLSDWDAEDISFSAWIRDLEVVVDAARLDRFALLGISRGGAVAIEYAARHPERVTHLILLGAYSRGWSVRGSGKDREIREAMVTLMRDGWGRDTPAFRQVWTSCFLPDGTPEQQGWFNELQRITTSPENAVRMQHASGAIDVSHRLGELRVPTLVCHARGDGVIRFDHGRRMAASIEGARFVPLDSRNHLLLEHEPAFGAFLSEVRRFLGTERDEPVVAMPASSSPGTSLPSGSVIGHYRIVECLGKGGMGIVYRAKDTKLGRDIALKVLAGEVVSDEQGRRQLLREARHVAVLNHPNICTVFDVVEIAGRDFIAMEYIVGQNLTAFVADGPIALATLCSIGAQIADALEHAHARGVIHGDLKSGNVIVTEDGRVKVLDFGVSRRFAVGDETMTAMSPATADRIGGTPAYMAPELLRGNATDTRSDLWSLGVLLYESAVGRLPFSGRNLYDLMTEILQNEPALPAPVEASPLGAVIRRCLQKDPDLRFQRGMDVRDALRIAEKSGL